jgi:acyl-CoA synthetase (AMP-forming)/AMP-acid ligase II
MLRDAQPKLICAGDAALAAAIRAEWSEAPRVALFDEIFSAANPDAKQQSRPPAALADSDPVKIIYTSGTSGEPKGVVLNAGNVNFMLGCTKSRLDRLMRGHAGTERVFHYLPFCFAASWIALLSFLSRDSVPTLSMARHRARGCVSGDSQAHRRKSESVDLRLRAATARNAIIFRHARHPGAAGVRTH